MKLFCLPLLSCLIGLLAFGQSNDWPILKTYSGERLSMVAMPVGGIGTGNISIGGNGQWKDVEIMNKPGMGFYGSTSSKQAPCFMIFTRRSNGEKMTRALMGPIPNSQFTGDQGSVAPNHGLPRFDSASFSTAYPFAMVNLEEASMPVSVTLKTFNPFVPADPESSGIPIAVIRYVVRNKTSEKLTVSVAGSLDNFVGMDGTQVEFNGFDRSLNILGAKNNRNEFRKTDALVGIYMLSDSVDKQSSAWGTIALTTPEINKGYRISYRTEFDPKGWNSNLNDMWDDFSDDGNFRDTVFSYKVSSPRAALSIQLELAPKESRELEFLLTWNFPNRKDWEDKLVIGNYYSTHYANAWDVAEKTVAKIPALESKTLSFVNLLLKSNYPDVVKEAALFNSSTLRSQTTFRNKEGYFFGWEGVFSTTGSCFGNCTHVWNYEQASPFLFGELASKMREVEYKFGLWDSIGLMSFRVALPLQQKQGWQLAAADGQMGTVMKVYREWQLSGNDDFLKKLWPGVKRALSFAWVPNGWDADQDGVMEGCQHNTMDIEYFGPNPEVEFWYLGALKAAAAMAAYLKDADFAVKCNKLFANGSKWTDNNLFNGEFYFQKVVPPQSMTRIAYGINGNRDRKDLQDPDFQIGEGCLVDQLVGQNMALICGLGWLADSQHVKKALQSIYKYNYVKSFGDHFNNMRSYALGDESGLMLTAYPDPSKRPRIPLSYAFEAWTGLEYTAATGMIYQNMIPEAMQTITNVRNRYDGRRRNPYNEEECGNHYARAMASWSTLLALSRFHYSGVEKSFSITAVPGNYFWSNGWAWGNAEVSNGKVKISVYQGTIGIKTLRMDGSGTISLKQPAVIGVGQSMDFAVGAK